MAALKRWWGRWCSARWSNDEVEEFLRRRVVGHVGPTPAAAAAWIADRGALVPQSRDDAARLLTAWRQEQIFAAR
eukprot:15470947-Alexandrium_andersonii.AAC.1